MKRKVLLHISIILVFSCWMAVTSCSKNKPAPGGPATFLTFSANDTSVGFPGSEVYIQSVTSLQTTLITGEFPDTVSAAASISIRVIGDTSAGRFSGDSILISYTDAAGNVYTNTTDSANFVEIDQFPKTAYGIVRGSFACKVANSARSIQLTAGVFMASFQD